MASLWAHFTLGSGWNCLSCFGPFISKLNFSLLFSYELQRPLIPQKSSWLFSQHLLLDHMLWPVPSFISAPVNMTAVYFFAVCPRTSRSSKFDIITLFQLLHVFLCSKIASRRLWGDEILSFGLTYKYKWLEVLSWIYKTNNGRLVFLMLTSGGPLALNRGLELWQYAWWHDSAWMAWIWNVAEATKPDTNIR